MATTKVSALTAKNTLGGSEEILINDGGTSKKSTVTAVRSTLLPLAGGTMTGNLVFADSVRARFGASNDLQIFHDTNNSYIENTGTGDLIIQDSGGDVRIKGKSNEDSIVANNDGSVDLYHDNTKKFETTAAGVDVTGNISSTTGADLATSSGQVVVGAAGSTWAAAKMVIAEGTGAATSGHSSLVIGNSNNATSSERGSGLLFGSNNAATGGAGFNDIYFTHRNNAGNGEGTSSRISSYKTSGADTSDLRLYTTNAERMRINSSGNVGIGTASPEEKLDVRGSIQVGTDGTTAGLIRFMDSGSVTEEATISSDASGGLIFGGNSGAGELIFNTGSGTERLRINSSGVATIGMTATTGAATVRIGSVGNASANGTGNLQFVNSSSYKSWQISAGGTPTGALAFTQSSANGASTFNDEAMRIDSSGKVLIGGTTNAYSAPMLLTVSDIGLDVTDGTKHLVSWASHGGSSHAGSAIGTRSNHDLALITNDVKRIIVTNAGNVGIGESAPESKLSLKSGSYAAPFGVNVGTFADSYINLHNTTANNEYSQLTFGYDGGSGANAAAYMGFQNKDTGAQGKGDLVFGTRAVNTDDTAPLERMRITSGGHIGIGTTSAAHKLSIQANANIHLGYNATSANTETGRISTNSYAVNNESYSLAEMSFVTSSANGYTGGIQFRTNSANSTNSRAAVRMTITSAGKVGIGTASPAELLHVESAANSTKIRIKNTKSGDTTGAELEMVNEDGGWQLGTGRGSLHAGEDTDFHIYGNGTRMWIKRSNGSAYFANNIHAGDGISFNGETDAAHLLDDYEEGTWTPTGTALAGGAAGTYTKIGNVVTVEGYFKSNATSTTRTSFGGLPFAAGNFNVTNVTGVGNSSYNTQQNSLIVRVDEQAATFSFCQSSANISLGDANSENSFTITYKVS